MDRLGCGIPIGFNIDNICTDQNKSIASMKLHKKLVSKSFTIKNCPYPCRFTKTYFRDKTRIDAELDEENPNPLNLYFIFNKFIKVSKARYVYRELELTAEFGGYVGLFLGISVFHLREVFHRIVRMNEPSR